MKKLSSIFIAVALIAVCLVLLPNEAQAAGKSDLTFTLNSDGQSYSVTDCNSTASGTLTIPATYNDKPVTSIGNDAFYGCTKLTTVTIPDSVTRIGNRAFKDCISLTSITIPDSVSRIGYESFKNCSLTSVHITDIAAWCGIKFGSEFISIDSNPLYSADILYLNGTPITDLVIPDGVTSIGYYAFSGYSGLTSVTIPDSVTSIDQGAFYGCNNLISVTIPESVTSIGGDAFYGCDNLPYNVYSDGKYLGNATNPYCVLMDTVSEDITSISINDATVFISAFAFSDCTGLTSVTIPDSVTSIGEGAFESCTSLSNVYITDIAAWCKIDFEGFLANPLCYSPNLYVNGALVTALEIPKGIKRINDYAFCNYTNLTGVTIPAGVKTIGFSAFYGCTNLTDITVPDSLTSIGGQAFQNCYIRKLTVADGAKEVTASMIPCKSTLKEVIIPDSVTYINKGALSGCNGLETITLPFVGYERKSATDSYQYPFGYIFGTVNYTLSTATQQYYYGSSTTHFTGDTYYIPNTLKKVTVTHDNIPFSAFYGCTGITEVILSDSTTTIGDRAFYNCAALRTVMIPDSVTTIGGEAFYGCTNLRYNNFGNCKYLGNENNPYLVLVRASSTSIVSCQIHPTTKFISAQAFYGCTGLTGVIIPDSVTTIGLHAFRSCTGLTEVTIGDGITSVSAYAFWGCTNLTRVTMGNGVSNIALGAFKDCPKLETVTYCGTQAQWDAILIAEENTALTADKLQLHKYQNGICVLCQDKAVYTVTFADWDGTVLSAQTHYWGESVIVPADPNRAADNTYTYAFAGWDNNVGNCTGNATYTATYIAACKYEYSVTNGKVTIARYVGNDEIVTIPSEIEGLPVTSVGAYAFQDCTSLTSVIIPDSVTSIGNYAFSGCSSLTSIVIPDSVTSIGSPAFSGCTSLSNVTIGNSVTSIGDYAFYNCSSLTSITIPDSVTGIGQYAFSGCNGLKHVLYTGGQDQWNAVSIGSYNTYLTDVMRHYECSGNEVTSVEECSWTGHYCSICDKPISVTAKETAAHSFTDGKCTACDVEECWIYTVSENGVTITDYTGTSKSVTIPSTIDGLPVTSVGGASFQNCTGIVDITIPNSITDIGDNAFYNCIRLTGVTIGDSVTSIGNSAFNGCTSLTSITIGNGVTYIGSDAFYNCTGLTDVYITDPSAWCKISFSSYFSNPMCYADNVHILDTQGNEVTEVVLDSTVTSISSYAFYGCTGLTSITIPDSVTSIGNSAFSGCTSLTSIIIPDSVTSIGNYAFNACAGLTSVTIPNGVVSIGNHAFEHCFKLAYITIPGSVTGIGAYAFNGCDNLTSVTIPDSVTSIGDYAFSFCSGLNSIQVDEGNPVYHSAGNCLIETASKKLIAGCNTSLIPSDGSVTVIDAFAFSDRVGLTSITIPSSVTSIGDGAFGGCIGLTSVTIPEGITRIDDYVFSYCTGLISVTVPTSVAAVDAYAFAGCTNLTVVFYRGTSNPKTVITIGTGNTAFAAAKWHYQAEEMVFADQECYYCDSCFSCFLPNGNKVLATVVFQDWDGTVLSTNTYRYRDPVTAPADPTRAADNIYTYAFKGWDKPVVDCTGNATYTATYTPTYINYTVIFVDEDGTELSRKTYHWDDEIVVPADPTKAADNTYTYPFAGWDNEVVNCAGNATYTATYKETYIDYTVEFKNWNGDVLSTKTYHWGEEIVVPNDPTKAADNIYTYAFKGWDNEVVNCAGDATYSATYTPKYINYTVVFKNWNGDVLSTKTYHWGEEIVVPANPTKTADNTYTYAFKEWDNEVVNCAGDATYKATYTPIYIDYTVAFKDWNGDVLSTKTYHWGEEIVVPANPTKTADNTYTYAFKEWDNEVVNCAGDATYSATYTPIYIDYTVEFKNWNGDVLSTKTYHWGEQIAAPATPTKAADNTYTYAFKGWDNEVVNCAGNVTYTATYTPTYIEYTVTFKNWDGSVLDSDKYHYNDTVIPPANPTRPEDSTYRYTFKGWDSEIVNAIANKIYTAVYEAIKKIVEITSQIFNVQRDSIGKIGTGTSADSFVSKLDQGENVEIYKGGTQVSGSTSVGTGMEAKLMDGNTVVKSYTVIVTGDTNGDGAISVTDMISIKAHLLGKSKLTGAYAEAGDTSGDDAISITDFIQLKAQILGKGNIIPN